MRSFLEYLLEAKEESQQKDLVEITSKEDLSKLNDDRYLKTLIGFLFRKVKEISKSNFVGIAVDKNLRQTNQTTKHGYKTTIKLNTINRNDRQKVANDILDTFKAGPMFIGDPNVSKKLEFVWFGNEDRIEEYLAKDSDGTSQIKKFERGKKMLDNLVKSGSTTSRYSIAYFSMENEDDSLGFLQGLFNPDSIGDKTEFWQQHLKEATSTKKEIPIVKAECIVDFTITSTLQVFETMIKDSNKLLDAIGISTAGDKNGYTNIPVFGNANETKSALSSYSEKIMKSKKKTTILDKFFYSHLFDSIANSLDSNVFSLTDFANSKIDQKTDFLPKDMSVRDVLSLKKYGPVVSEILIPFLLLSGIKQVKTNGSAEQIIDGMSDDDEIQSVEIPKSSNHPLTDYDVIFVNAENKETGEKKKYAISAKYGEHFNHSSLLGLIAKKKENTDLDALCGKESDFRKVFAIAKETKKDLTGSAENIDTTCVGDVIRIADALKNKLDGELDEDYVRYGKVQGTFRDMIENAIEQSVKAVYLDKVLVSHFNKDPEFLATVYNFLYDYYGEGVEFQQIELKEDLSLKRITIRKKTTKKKASSKIAMLSSSSISKDGKTGNVRQPLQIELK